MRVFWVDSAGCKDYPFFRCEGAGKPVERKESGLFPRGVKEDRLESASISSRTRRLEDFPVPKPNVLERMWYIEFLNRFCSNLLAENLCSYEKSRGSLFLWMRKFCFSCSPFVFLSLSLFRVSNF